MRLLRSAIALIAFLLSGAPGYTDTESAHTLLSAIASTRQRLDQATNPTDKARLWLAIQASSDKLYKILPRDTDFERCYDPSKPDETAATCPGYDVVQQAKRLGVTIWYCGAGEAWMQADDGWEHYLQLWPDGPEADRAWWVMNVEPACCDECTPTDTDSFQYLIGVYQDFIKRFPHSSLRPQAETKIQTLRTQRSSLPH